MTNTNVVVNPAGTRGTKRRRTHEPYREGLRDGRHVVYQGQRVRDVTTFAVRALLEKYFGSAAPAQERLRVINLVDGLCTGAWGGYQSVLTSHAEGSLEAEKLQILRSCDWARPRACATELIALGAALPLA